MKTKSAIQKEPTLRTRTKKCLHLSFLCVLFLGILPVSADELVIESDLKVEGKVEVGQSMTVSGDDGVLFLGDGPSSPYDDEIEITLGSGNIPIEGAGTRFMWYPAKAALRAGLATEGQWNDPNIGLYSTALGCELTASGLGSTAVGYMTTASGTASTAMGIFATALGDYSTAMGWGAFATGGASTAMGEYTHASGWNTTAMGIETYAVAYGSTAMGIETYAGAYGSTAMGSNTIALGDGSTAMGIKTVATARASLAIGQYNIGGGHRTQWNPQDPIFEIGNGTGNSQDPMAVRYSNAFTVYKNGNVKMTGNVTMPRQGDILMGEFGNPE